MSKKSKQAARRRTETLCCTVLRRRLGRVSSQIAQDQREGRSRQGGRRENPGRQPQAAERFPGETLRAGPLVAAADLSGHGCRRQGLGDQERVRRRQPAGLRGHLVQAAVNEGARSRFPVAQHDRAARARPHRHLQSLLLRGMPRRAGASGNPRQAEDSAKRLSPGTSGANGSRTSPRSSVISPATAP